MKEIYPNIWQTSVEKPFPGLNTHAYLIKRNEGNVLFYNTSNKTEIEQFKSVGGVNIQFVSHRHESGSTLGQIKALFGSKLSACKIESPFIDGSIDIKVTERFDFSEDIEVIPTPGHTAGGLSFIYESHQGIRFLFTGDTLFQSKNQWATLAYTAHGGSSKELISTLNLYKELNPDIVISSGYSGERCIVEINRAEWSDTVDQIIENV